MAELIVRRLSSNKKKSREKGNFEICVRNVFLPVSRDKERNSGDRNENGDVTSTANVDLGVGKFLNNAVIQ